MKILFLTCDKLDGFVVDDGLAVNLLREKGHEIDVISWSKNGDWSKYDCAVIRTTWDYMERKDEFLRTLSIISEQTHLYNSLQTVKWNIHKAYLKDLEAAGISIVPTQFFTDVSQLNIPESWSYEIVIKPCVSAGSFQTHRLKKDELETIKLPVGDWMCQPFLPQIREGEYSLVYFNKSFSHALLKVPKSGDFRVQEEFGGNIIPYKPDAEMLQLGEKIMNAAPGDLLYARVDLVPYKNHYALMELELIEPSLYLRTHEKAAENFIKALINGRQ